MLNADNLSSVTTRTFAVRRGVFGFQGCALENRTGTNFTQEELAKKLGVAFSTVNRWFNEKTRPSKIQRYHIEKLLRTKKTR